MKKFIILSLAFVLMFSFAAMATNTRVNTMGYNNMIVIDDANIEIFPGRLIEFSNLAIGEFNSSDFRDFGMIWKVAEKSNWNMGAFFTTQTGLGDFNSVPNFGLYPTSFNDRITLYYGREMGSNKLGFKFEYMNAGYEETDTLSTNNDETEKLNHMEFTFGLTEGSGQWDVAANIGFGSFTNEINDSIQNEADGISNLGLVGRYFMVKNPNYTLVPHAGFSTDKFGWKDVVGDLAESYKMTYIELGCGFNFTPSNNVLAVLDVGVAIESEKYEFTTAGVTDEDKYTTTTLPYFKLGLDAEVFKWLDVRFGMQSDWHREKDEINYNNLNEWKYNYVNNQSIVGLGFHWNRLHIDTEANPDFFIEGPDFLSGADEDMAFALSVLYEL